MFILQVLVVQTHNKLDKHWSSPPGMHAQWFCILNCSVPPHLGPQAAKYFDSLECDYNSVLVQVSQTTYKDVTRQN